MDTKEPIKIRMRGNFGEVDLTVPAHVIDWNVSKEVENRGLAAVRLAIEVYKAMGPKSNCVCKECPE